MNHPGQCNLSLLEIISKDKAFCLSFCTVWFLINAQFWHKTFPLVRIKSGQALIALYLLCSYPKICPKVLVSFGFPKTMYLQPTGDRSEAFSHNKRTQLWVSSSVTRKKLPNDYKSCLKMISLQKWLLLTPLEKLPRNVRDLGKLIVAKDFKKLPKVQ